jgi:hypothetical protein
VSIVSKQEFVGSTFTGKYWPCSFNITHHPTPVALPIKRGPVRHFLPQCICGGNGRASLLPPDWTDDMGLTEQQARAKGLLVLAVTHRRTPNKR